MALRNKKQQQKGVHEDVYSFTGNMNKFAGSSQSLSQALPEKKCCSFVGKAIRLGVSNILRVIIRGKNDRRIKGHRV